jgi:hypothetical protein
MPTQMTFVMSQPSECQVAAFASKLLINDRSVASESGKIFATINPATEVTEGQAHRQPNNASPKVPLEPSLPILIQVVVPTQSCRESYRS